MGLILKYVQKMKTGIYRYRRRLPKEVSSHLGQGEFVKILGESEREALKAYPAVHARFEQLVEDAKREAIPRDISNLTQLEVFYLAKKMARKMQQGIKGSWGEWNGLPITPEDADIWLDIILDKVPRDERGDMIGEPPDPLLAQALVHLRSEGAIARPAPTLEDAKRLYIKDKVKGDISEKRKMLSVERNMKLLKIALTPETRIVDITREHAREVKEHLLKDCTFSPTTAKRYLNEIKLMLNHAITEFELKNYHNPFLNLPIKTERHIRTERDPMPEKVIVGVRKQLEAHAGSVLRHIWHILENTGCRLGEVTGLLVSDVVLEGDGTGDDRDFIPHIKLQFHAHRRLKNNASIRNVPLLGRALEAAKAAVKEAVADEQRVAAPVGSAYLFPAYGKPRGADSASQILMKHEIVVHSLRHTMEDRLIKARVDEFDRNLILGHAKGAMSERYGGDEARLIAAERALRVALRI